ncbi:MAG: alkyl hydroperoxide reductase, partial [Mycobacteriales bacterium]
MAKVRAPELSGRGGWIGSEPLTLGSLRGRFVLLDFFSYCCVNCLHVIDELRPLEERLADVLTVIG